MKLRTQLAGLVALAATLPVFAQIKVNDNLSVTGWAVGSYQYLSPSPGSSSDSLNVDAALLQAIITYKPITANFSVYYRPDAGGSAGALTGDNGVSPSGAELTLLDANIVWAATDSLNITAGKFLSYLGFESFYQADDNQITLANQQFLAPIPGYHEGIKFDYTASKTDTVGIAFVDSLYQKPGYNGTEGSDEVDHNGGIEAYAQDTSINNLTIWAGVGYGSKGTLQPYNVYVYDLWMTYVVDKNITLDAEEIYKNTEQGPALETGSNWLAELQYTFNPKWSSVFRISGEDVDQGGGGPSYFKYTICPAYKINDHVTVRAEYSYISYDNLNATNAAFYGLSPADQANFFGVQTVLTF